jgi:hypothetical protein
MSKLIFLVGLCGAGKSRKANEMASQGFVWLGEGLHGNRMKYQYYVDALRAGRDCVAEEFQTLTQAYRTHIKTRFESETPPIPNLQVEFHFFEKDLAKANRNILSRPDDKKVVKDHLFINAANFDNYEIPSDPGTVILPIDPPTAYHE